MASTNDSTRQLAGASSADLDGLVRRFDEAWERGDRPSIPDYLDTAGGQTSALVALIHHDLKHRLESGEAARVEHYLEGFPELRDDQSFLKELLATEYDIRKSRDGDFPMAEYVSRFPQMAADIISFLIGPKRRDHTVVLEKDQSKAVTESPGLQNTIIEPSLSAMVSKSQEQAETLFHSDSNSDGQQQPGTPRTNVPGYEILGELGRGGMGVVYKARQISLKRLVALKMIISGQHAGQKDLARFQGEAEVLAQLHNPNIVQIYDINEHEGFPYFALEYIDGGTLSDKVAGKPMDPRQAAELMRAVAVAVNSAHKADIVHRDLKPDNILLTTDGTPKITDFGLAKSVKGDSGRTQTGTVMGTPGYMAPEQALGKTREVGPASDLYSLGAILYEMLTGRPPFRGETPVDTMLLVVSEDPQPLTAIQPGVPRDLETICLKCLQKEIDQRYGSCQDFADELTRFLENEPILARPISRAQRLVRWCRRNAAMVAVSGLAAVLFVGLAVAMIYRVNNPEAERIARNGTGAGGVQTGDDAGPDLPAQDGSMEALKDAEAAFDRDKDMAKLQEALRHVAEQKDPEPGEQAQKRLKYFQSLVQARSTDPAAQKEAAAQITTLLAEPAVHRPDLLFDALTHLAQSKPPAIPMADAIKVLRGAAEGSDDRYKGVARGHLRTLQTEQVQHAVLLPNVNWADLLRDCNEADDNNNWVKAAKAEAMLEEARGKYASKTLDEVMKALPSMVPADTPEGAYATYVLAFWQYASKDTAEAAKKVRGLFAVSPLPPPLTLPSRQQRAIEILEKSVDARRAPDGGADPFRPPFKADALGDVYSTLKTALDLCGTAQVPPSNALRLDLARAAWFKQPRDAGLARKLAAEISTQGLKEDQALPIRALKLQLLDGAAPTKEALIAYADSLTPLRTYLIDKGILWESPEWYKNIVKPGIELGKQLKVVPKTSDYDARRALAALYFQKGLMIALDPTIVPDPIQQMKEAVELAPALDEQLPKFQQAKCIFQRDVALMYLGPPDLKQFERDADTLEQLDAKYPGAYYLRGYVRSTEALKLEGSDPAGAIKKRQEAKDWYTRAIDLLKAEDAYQELPVSYMQRGYNYFRWSFIADARSQVQLLEDAAKDAREALRSNPSLKDADALLGNALEELAWHGKTDSYGEAVAAFEDARQKDTGNLNHWIALARCKFKYLRAEETKGAESQHPNYLPEGIKQLQHVIEADQGKPTLTPGARAEANFWLASLLAMDNKSDEAEKSFDAVMALKDQPKTQVWVGLAMKDGADNLLKRVEANVNSADPASKALLTKARKLATDLSKLHVRGVSPKDSARLLAHAAKLEGKPLEGVTRCLEAFKKDPERPDEATLLLGAQLLDLMTDPKWRVDLRGKTLPEGGDKEAIAARGDSLAKLSNELQGYRNRIYGLAALAHLAAINVEDAKQQQRHRDAARAKLEVAVQGTRKDSPEGWRWRFELAKVYRDLWITDKSKKTQEEALRLAQEARGGQQIPNATKTQILRLIKELQPSS